MMFWREDARLTPYAAGMDTPFYDGFKRPVTPASSAVAANYTVVDMFASVVTGNTTPEAAARRAAQQAARYYKTT
jgi:multiple sugar transport system substrate-binding protein